MNIKDIKNLNKIESFNGNFAIYYNTDGMAGIINRQGEVWKKRSMLGQKNGK